MVAMLASHSAAVPTMKAQFAKDTNATNVGVVLPTETVDGLLQAVEPVLAEILTDIKLPTCWSVIAVFVVVV